MEMSGKDSVDDSAEECGGECGDEGGVKVIKVLIGYCCRKLGHKGSGKCIYQNKG